jgi:hypothetical protein
VGTIQAIACTPAAGPEPCARSDLGGIAASIQPPGRKGDTCAPGADQVLEPALQRMASDPDAHVRAMAAELVGKFVHTDGRAVTALETACAQDPNPTVRKKAGWFAPGGTIYKRTVPRVPR